MMRPGPGSAWLGIIGSALLFGIGHLPVAATILPLTALWVTRILLLKTLGGRPFGWLYWRKGLLFAMSAHWMADIALHVVRPILVGGADPVMHRRSAISRLHGPTRP